MTNKTLKDTLIDLYHSGDLVPVWDEDDTGRFVVDFEPVGMCLGYCKSRVAEWFLRNDPAFVIESLIDDSGELAEKFSEVDEFGLYARAAIRNKAWKSLRQENADSWDEAMAHITELENSR